jgi:hypothetical protein
MNFFVYFLFYFLCFFSSGLSSSDSFIADDLREQFRTDEEKELLLLYILFSWYERISGIVSYLDFSSVVFEKIERLDIAIMNRFRNPVKHKSNVIDCSSLELLHFNTLCHRLDVIFDEYVFLSDLGKIYLTGFPQAAVIDEVKSHSLHVMLSKLLTLKRLFSFFDTFYLHFIKKGHLFIDEQSDCDNDFFDQRKISLGLLENIHYYKDIYIRTDRLILDILNKIFEAKIALRKTVFDFWKLIGSALIESIKEQYNQRVLAYIERCGELKKLHLPMVQEKVLPKEIL